MLALSRLVQTLLSMVDTLCHKKAQLRQVARQKAQSAKVLSSVMFMQTVRAVEWWSSHRDQYKSEKGMTRAAGRGTEDVKRRREKEINEA